MRYLFIILFLTINTSALFAQTGELEGHWEISLPVSYSLSERWSMNTTISSRTGFYRQVQEDNRLTLFVNFMEVTQYATYRAGHNVSLTGGYRYRSVNPTEALKEREHRLIQQMGVIHLRAPTRIASRIQTEQRWHTDNFSHRLRYRLSIDRPLQGQKLDIGEFYGIVSNEVVSEFGKEADTSLENRISFGLGNKWGRSSKLQVEAQIRSNDVLDLPIHTLFIMTGFYFNLD